MMRITAAICACVLVGTALGNPGELDSTFGQNGIARIALPAASVITAVAIQPDGKIVAVGNSTTSSATTYVSDFLVVRLNSDGTPDTTFDGDGIKTFGFGTGSTAGSEVANAVVITADNKILIGGVAYRPNQTVFGQGVVTRLRDDGSLDTSFGVGGVTYLSHSTGTSVGKIVPLADGKFLLGGNTDNSQGLGDLIVFRIFANGAVDSTFGTSGRTVLDFDRFGEYFSGLALASDGRIVIAGTSSKSGNKGMSIARLTSNGQLDTSVPLGKFSFNVGYRDSINGISLQNDGKLILASHMDTGQFRGLGMIVRLNTDGTRDTSFGSNGRIVRTASASALTTDNNGHIYFVGEPLSDTSEPTPGRSTVQAIDVDGSALADFGRAGRTVIDAGNGSQPSSITSFAINRLADGRLLVFGRNSNTELVISRLLASGGYAGVISLLPVPSGTQTAISETAGSISFNVLRTGGSAGPVTVNYSASSTTATGGVDYAPTSGTLSWADGDAATKTIVLPLLDDYDYEPNTESISMTLSAPTGGAKIGTAIGTVAVSSDDPQSALQFPFGSQVLANAGSVQVPVQRTGDARGRTTVDYTTRAISAIAGTDFQPVSGTLVWESWDVGDKFITVPILDDSAANNTAKRFAIDLSNASNGAAINYPVSGETEIRPYHDGGALLFDSFVTVVSESTGTITLTVRPTATMNSELTVNVVATPFSTRGATAGVDFVTPTQTVNWAQNDTSPRTITFSILNDALPEGTEVVDVTITNNLGNWAYARIVILDDDSIAGSSQVQLSTNTLNVSETGSAVVAVTRTGNLAFPASVQWRIVNGTAGSTDIFVAASPPTLNWAAGDSAPKTITIPIVSDLIAEPDETFTVQLFNSMGGAALGAISETLVTITETASNIGPTTQFTQSAFTISEDAEYIDLPLVNSLSNSSAYFYRLSALPDSTAELESEFVLIPEESYIGFFGSMTDAPSLRLYLNGDSKIEGNETISVLLRGRSYEPPIGPTRIATITLVSDDAAQVPVELSVSPTSVSVAESAGTVSILVNRTGSTTSPVSVNYQTVAGTAVAGTDFVAASGTLVWPIGDSTPKTVAISLVNDTTVEGSEEFTLQLTSPTNATITAATVAFSISDDDSASPGSGGNPGSGNPVNNGTSNSGSGGGGSMDIQLLIALLTMYAAYAIRRVTPINVNA